MNESQLNVHGILDIEQPVIPADNGLLTTLICLSLLILLIIMTALAIRYYNSRRLRARRRLHLLYRSASNKLDDPEILKSTAYQLSDILAAGVGLKGITSTTTLPLELSQHHDRWQRFTSGLSTIRYARQDSYAFSLDEIFQQLRRSEADIAAAGLTLTGQRDDEFPNSSHCSSA